MSETSSIVTTLWHDSLPYTLSLNLLTHENQQGIHAYLILALNLVNMSFLSACYYTTIFGISLTIPAMPDTLSWNPNQPNIHACTCIYDIVMMHKHIMFAKLGLGLTIGLLATKKKLYF